MQAAEGELWWVRPVAGALCSQTGDFFTYPIDTSKTRLQLSGEGGGKKLYTGMLDAMRKVARHEGSRGLYKGFSAALLRQGFYRGAVFGIYEPVRDLFGSGPIARIVSGGVGGALANGLVNPLDLVKVRMQADLTRTRYTNVFQALFSIARFEGVGGMFKGVTPSMQRAFLVNASELATYDYAKEAISGRLGSGLHSNFLAAFVAGFVAACASTPADVMKTRLMNQPVDPNTGKGSLYKSMLDCGRKTVQREGLFALYKGFVPTWLRLGPYTVISFVSFEQYRSMFNSITVKKTLKTSD